MNTKPKLSFWQIWNMSFGFLGIQFGFALQNANVSRIFETLGASIDDIPILWIAAPVTGLIIQPIIGYMSDKTWTRLGRRRPYFLVGAILASLALFIMPNSPLLWVAAGTLWIMDASINVSMEPFRAFVGDMLSEEQRTRGFAMQSFFIGVGAVIASMLPYILANWFGMDGTAVEGEIPPQVKWSFYIGALVFITAVCWTVFRTKEYSPEELKAFEQEKEADEAETLSAEELAAKSKKALLIGAILTLAGIAVSLALTQFEIKKEMYILGIGLGTFGVVELYAGLLLKMGKHKSFAAEIMADLNAMPKAMGQLAVVQFFSWFALFAMWIYATSAITSHVYNTSDTTSVLYNQGADWVGVAFGVYNGFAAVFAFLLPVMAKYTNRKITHMLSLIIGGVSLASIYFVTSPEWLLVPFVGIGLAWASILSMPYAILTGSLPAKKMGVYMGIFNFFIVIPQILAASLLGYFTIHLFDNRPILSLVLGGVSMVVSGLLVLFVEDKKSAQE